MWMHNGNHEVGNWGVIQYFVIASLMSVVQVTYRARVKCGPIHEYIWDRTVQVTWHKKHELMSKLWSWGEYRTQYYLIWGNYLWWCSNIPELCTVQTFHEFIYCTVICMNYAKKWSEWNEKHEILEVTLVIALLIRNMRKQDAAHLEEGNQILHTVVI